MAANQADFKAAPEYGWKEHDRTGKGSRTSQVTMIEGSPYYRLLAVNDKPLSAEQQAEEQKKQEQATIQRRAESSEQRRQRIEKFEKARHRDNEMMSQLTKAFKFTLLGTAKVNGFNVWSLKATPRPDYQPPNMEARVLTGMEGQIWIDQESYQWVKVTANVVRPVSIGGFLAQVQPGTKFELEKSPVANGIWLASRFSMKSDAKVLHLINRTAEEEETFYAYQKAGAESPTP